jgi:hypothetical protein
MTVVLLAAGVLVAVLISDTNLAGGNTAAPISTSDGPSQSPQGERNISWELCRHQLIVQRVRFRGVGEAGIPAPVVVGEGVVEESGKNWGRLRGQFLVIGGVGEVGVPAVEVVGEVVVEDSGP